VRHKSCTNAPWHTRLQLQLQQMTIQQQHNICASQRGLLNQLFKRNSYHIGCNMKSRTTLQQYLDKELLVIISTIEGIPKSYLPSHSSSRKPH
jgi:hypothetical protein